MENDHNKIKFNNTKQGGKAMITGNYKEDIARVAENLMIAFSVEFIKSAPNIKRWEEAIQNSFDIATTIVNKEYKFLEKEK